MVLKSYQAYVLFGKEANYGEEAASIDKDFGIIRDISFRDANNLEGVRSVGSRDIATTVAGEYGIDGSIRFAFQHGRIFELALGGSVTHTDLTGGDYKHEFAVADELPSISIEDGVNATNDYVRKWLGCKINRLTLTHSVGSAIEITAEFIGKKVALSTTAQSFSPSSENILKWGSSFKLGGNSVGKLQDFTLRIMHSLRRDLSTSSRFLDSLSEHERAYEFDFTILFEDEETYKDFLGDATGPADSGPSGATAEFDVDNGIAAGSGQRKIYIKFANAYLNTAERPVRIGDTIVARFSGYAHSLSEAYCVDGISDTAW